MEYKQDVLRYQSAWIAVFCSAATLVLFSIVTLLPLSPSDSSGLNLFPEHIKYFKIKDPTAQKIGYFVAAFFALLASVSFCLPVWLKLVEVIRRDLPAMPPWLKELEIDPSRVKLENWLSRSVSGPRPFVIAFLLLCASGLYWVQNTTFKKLAVADPHIFYVSQELGDAILSNTAITPQMLTAYGVGHSLIYVLSNSLFEGPVYLRHAFTGKIFNMLLAASFLWLCYRISRDNAGRHYGIVFLILAFALSFTLIGPVNNGFELISNLSAIRYTPLIFLFLAFSSFGTKRSLIIDSLQVFVGAGLMLLFPDVGTFCFLSILCFLLARQRIGWNLLPIGLAYIAIAVCSVLVVNAVVEQFFGIDVFAFYIEMAARFGKNYGGLELKLSINHLTIPFVALSCFFYFAFQAFRKELEDAERVSLALSACFILMLMYYVNRPSNVYWVFGLLLLVPAHVVLNDVFKLADFRVKIIAFFTVYAVLINMANVQYKHSISDPRKTVSFSQTSNILGMQIEADKANVFNDRLVQLSNATEQRSNSLVFSTTPSAVSSIKHLEHLPQELVFKNNNQDALELTLEVIAAKAPEYVIFERDWKYAYARPVAERITKRIKDRIGSGYTRTCLLPYWDVYRKNDVNRVEECK